MAIHPNKAALAALGLFTQIRNDIFGGGRKNDDSVYGEDEASDDLTLEKLIETGETAFDEFVMRLKNDRDRTQANIQEGAEKALSWLGVATRKEIQELKSRLGVNDEEKRAGETAD
jgi:hypothetical protein